MVGSLDPDDRVDGTAEHDAWREAEALGGLASEVEHRAVDAGRSLPTRR